MEARELRVSARELRVLARDVSLITRRVTFLLLACKYLDSCTSAGKESKPRSRLCRALGPLLNTTH